MKRDVAPPKPRPTVPCRVDPPDEVEVVHVLDRTKISSLRRKRRVEHSAHIRRPVRVANLPILQTRQRQGRHSGPPFLKPLSVATCGVRYEL
jgi:hypothetical protein